MMMIVVPAFAHREDGEPKAILALLSRIIATTSEHVTQRIDGERGVVENHRAKKESDHQPHHAVAKPEMSDEVAERARNHGRDENILIEPD